MQRHSTGLPSIELNGQPFGIVDNFCYLGDKIGTRGGDSVTANIRSEWSKFRDLVPLLASRGVHLGVRSRLYSTCVHSARFYGIDTWPVKEEDLIRLDK